MIDTYQRKGPSIDEIKRKELNGLLLRGERYQESDGRSFSRTELRKEIRESDEI